MGVEAQPHPLPVLGPQSFTDLAVFALSGFTGTFVREVRQWESRPLGEFGTGTKPALLCPEHPDCFPSEGGIEERKESKFNSAL